MIGGHAGASNFGLPRRPAATISLMADSRRAPRFPADLRTRSVLALTVSFMACASQGSDGPDRSGDGGGGDHGSLGSSGPRGRSGASNGRGMFRLFTALARGPAQA